jgi:hypothetical protein
VTNYHQRWTLIGVYDFNAANQVIIAYHVVCKGDISRRPSWWITGPDKNTVSRWPGATGTALADRLRSQGHTPTVIEWSAQTNVNSSLKSIAVQSDFLSWNTTIDIELDTRV